MGDNDRKAQLLGMPFGTANNQLRKKLLFHLASKLGEVCYRCEKSIETVDDFSVEHKKAWMYAEDPKVAFFDLDNIAFSHISCNIKAGSRPAKKYSDKNEMWREAARCQYADPERYAQHLKEKRESYHRRQELVHR